MLNKIKKLEQLARQLEVKAEDRKDLNSSVIEYADHFLDQLPQKKAYELNADLGEGIHALEIQESGRPVLELLAALYRHVDHNGINPASGRHFGYIPGGGVFPAALGDYLADVTNRYAGMFFANPGAVQIEHQLIRWMCDMIGYPDTAIGNLASGGSIATLTAIVTARQAHGIKGAAIEKAVIYLTRQTHHCAQKAFRIAGLEDAQFRYIPMDEHFRMNAQLLRQAIEADIRHGLTPFLVIGSGGTTDTGAIDPLDLMALIAEEHNCWFHVDAAYGGFFMLSDQLKPAFTGIERADSVVIDPHKGLFIPYGTGAVLIKNARAAYDAHYYTASYLQDADVTMDQLSPADVSPELTKHFRGLRMWMPLQLFGTAPFSAALEEKVLLCRYFYKEIQKIGFETGPEPDLSVMIYRYVPEEGDANTFNEQLIKHTREDGRIFLSTTTLDGVYWIRLAVLSFRTHLDEIKLLLSILKDAVATLQNEQLSV